MLHSLGKYYNHNIAELLSNKFYLLFFNKFWLKVNKTGNFEWCSLVFDTLKEKYDG